MDTHNKSLYYLSELSDYKISSDYSDIRGWKIIDADNRTIGTVDNLMVNKETLRVVYLDVVLDKHLIEDSRNDIHNQTMHDSDREFMYKDGNDHIIIPIGSVAINKDTKIVMASGIRYETFLKTGRYNKEQRFDRAYEQQVMNSYYPETKTTDTKDDDFYNRREFNGL